ncbi:MAG: bifunctional diguanylate cyclase/phosphohydrolase [Planctomycetota bacterium]
MTDNTSSSTQPEYPIAAGLSAEQPAALISEVGALLGELEAASTSAVTLPESFDTAVDNQLAQVRLGIASSLYTALRLKHAATAGHGLRVALSSSAWATEMKLSQEDKDVIEVAALLHDVGMIGVPDHILLKPGPLDAKEALVVGRARKMSLQVLRSACAEPEILQIIEHIGAWYDGSKPGHSLAGDRLPLGSRMINVVEAFDAMTTDHVYRPALSLERATSELFRFAGTQFDPELVRQFVERHVSDQSAFRRRAATQWLRALDPEAVNAFWELGTPESPSGFSDVDTMFPTKLMENMHDAVVFVDVGFRVTQWNHGAERLTGISRSSALERHWLPNLLKMQNEKSEPVTEEDCPLMCAIRSNVQSLRRLTIRGRNGRPVSVDGHAIPVMTDEGAPLGAVLLLHDASSETTLEARCQSLHEKATKDPLTQVANRAEFDRVHEAFIKTHRRQQIPCSLIICDLDLFKRINDTYGHQAGDDAIKTLAQLLKNSCRPGDLVARYGGEEFVILCADCDNATGARRAEQIRKTLSQTPQRALGDRCITASFGVTEIQPGDTPETMFRRADRALLTAKSKGRNRVVQLGVGSTSDEPRDKKRRFWRRSPHTNLVFEQRLLTPVPIAMAIEKLRGFVADHRAKIVAIDGNHVRLEITSRASQMRRRADRSVTFAMDVRLEEAEPTSPPEGGRGGSVRQTRIHLTLCPAKDRDRRRAGVTNRAREVLASLRSYLTATVEKDPARMGILHWIRRFLMPWSAKCRQPGEKPSSPPGG